MSFGAVSFARWKIQNPLASETPGSSKLRSQPASGLGKAGNVYTCHERGGGAGQGRKRKPQQSPKLLNSSGEGAAGAEL